MFWDNWADKYEDHYNLDRKSSRVRLMRKVELLIKETGMCKGKTVLEVGYGTGIFTEQFDKTGARIIGIDISPKMQEVALRKKLVNTSLFIRNAEDTQFPSNYFDIATGAYVLQWLQMDNFFSEMNRVLKPDGKLVVLAKNGENPLTFIEQLKFTVKYIMNDSVFSDIVIAGNIVQRLKRHGFVNINIKPIEFTHWRWMNNVLENIPIIRNIAGSLVISAEKHKTTLEHQELLGRVE